MTMKEQPHPPRFERRWPVVLAIVVGIVIMALTPGRIRMFPVWFPYLLAVVVVTPIVAAGLTSARAVWVRIECTVTLLFVVVTGAANLAILANLINAMVRRSAEISGGQLLTSSIAVWVTNVLVFSLLYWQMDRGGPEARLNIAGTRVDWLFPQEGAPAEDVPAGWLPAFVDYLFLSYSTATAFSTADVMPLTSRAKMLMMLESAISLTTMVVVASRAINILGS